MPLTNSEIRMVPVERIHPNPNNPRHQAGNVSGLARSITEESLLQPLLVIPAPQYGIDHVMIEDGFRRWVAGKEVQRSLPCQVRYAAPEEDRALRAILTGLVTDAHKEPLSGMERALAYGRLHDEFGLTQAEIAKRTGFTTGTIGYYMSLLDLTEKSRADVVSGKLSVDKAVAAVRSERQKNRVKAGKKQVDVGWDPDPFASHPLGNKAKTMCVAREHGSRRRYFGACHACWETVIRQDEAKVQALEYGEAGKGAVPFVAPTLVAITGDGGIRTDASPSSLRRGTGNAGQ